MQWNGHASASITGTVIEISPRIARESEYVYFDVRLEVLRRNGDDFLKDRFLVRCSGRAIQEQFEHLSIGDAVTVAGQLQAPYIQNERKVYLKALTGEVM